jgi:quercetin dioxygenase-like cupin family protein
VDAAALNELPPLRRVVTGHDDANVARVLIDAVPTNAKYPASGTTSTLLWVTDTMPADIAVGLDIEDAGSRTLGTSPPQNGTRFCIIDYPPHNSGSMHRTETIDYVIVLAGEIDMELDDATVHLKAGDVLVQRGTNHKWCNRSDAPARVAFVLVDALPLGIGHARA